MCKAVKVSKSWRLVVALSLVAAAAIAGQRSGAGASVKSKREKPAAGAAPKMLKVDLNKAVKVDLKVTEDLKPAAFKTADGRTGWAVRIPGGRPIATPAYAGGTLFVGGGYGS
ncbi:MAG TPA: hypothetical protein VD968_10385, partial [Pyrinomonadaceae bacterium]|nr:hypothetical protein [Pyrinomonadaceae bacterium]